MCYYVNIKISEGAFSALHTIPSVGYPNGRFVETGVHLRVSVAE